MRLPLPSDALADRAAWQPFARDLLLDAASVTTNTALGAPPPTSPLHTQVLLDGALTASVQSFGMFSYGSQIVNLKSVVDCSGLFWRAPAPSLDPNGGSSPGAVGPYPTIQ